MSFPYNTVHKEGGENAAIQANHHLAVSMLIAKSIHYASTTEYDTGPFILCLLSYSISKRHNVLAILKSPSSTKPSKVLWLKNVYD